MLFDTIDKKYYQITAIDEFSRKRILDVVDEKSVTNTSRFIRTLEEKMELKINTGQTDNGPEFVNNQVYTKFNFRWTKQTNRINWKGFPNCGWW